MEGMAIEDLMSNSLLKLYNGKTNLKEMAIYTVATIATATSTWSLIKKGIIVQLAITAIALYFYRKLAKENRFNDFREEIKKRNLTDKDLQELTCLTRKRSSESQNMLSKIVAGLGVLVLPGYSWFIVELLKMYFSGNLQGEFLLIFGTASAFSVGSK